MIGTGDDTESDATKYLALINGKDSPRYGAVSISRTLYSAMAIRFRAQIEEDHSTQQQALKGAKDSLTGKSVKPSAELIQAFQETKHKKKSENSLQCSNLHHPNQFYTIWKASREAADSHMFALNNYIMYVSRTTRLPPA